MTLEKLEGSPIQLLADVKSLMQHKDDFDCYCEEYVLDTKPFVGRYGNLDLTDPFNKAWIDTELEDRISLSSFSTLFFREIEKRGGCVISDKVITSGTTLPKRASIDVDAILKAQIINKKFP